MNRRGDANVPSDRVIRVWGQEVALGSFALLLMLIAILLPTVMYSLNLREPTPAELLVAISIGMFASVLYLWVLDATSTIPFRSVWISRGVWGAAIVSILGTSVGVYKDAFAQHPFPFQGEWLLTVQDAAGKTLVAQRPVALVYSQTTGVYWGYSAGPESVKPESDGKWAEVTAFDPGKRRVQVRLRDTSGLDEVVSTPIQEIQPRTAFSSQREQAARFVVRLARRNY